MRWSRERVLSAAAVVLLHLLIGYAFVTGLAQRVAVRVGEELRVFDVAVPPPPPPAVEEAPEPEGAAAPPAERADPEPVVAPKPIVPLPVPPPVTAAPVAREGAAPSAGAADTPGPGTGAGGTGTGTGAGGSGTGAGGAARAQRVSGRLEDRDYPRAALRARAEGSVSVRYVVGVDGRARDCAVTRSSGNTDLDSTTCRLIERRFRYRPATGADGRPAAETVTRTFDWSIPAGQ
jgi:periplasmic protein TonB